MLLQVGPAKYSYCESYATELVGRGQCYLLGSVDTERNHRGGTIPAFLRVKWSQYEQSQAKVFQCWSSHCQIP